ncbi:Transmembrane 9 superfamily member 4 [Symbiodinium microadriaticum]|uniref:Transmembrane 9 superfamily member n=1 Tax=Symbiodinium microadriaticum TaxID=2951 RepID=A0A1Q9EEN4_SYMMI|nr:Transmembrane 9 superfamily member 4 [Symbiodinium microadriaticum]
MNSVFKESRDLLTFTYDVVWTDSDIRWASRFDNYLKMTGGQIHWFSILNSFVIMLFLSGMIAVIILRTIHRDITKYNELASAEEAAEETGWKLVHGDVFRKPRHSKLLAVSVGSGVQIICMSVVTLFLALLGVLSPVHRGALLQSCLLLFTFMGFFAGYVSSRLYKTFNGADWKQMTLLTAFLLRELAQYRAAHDAMFQPDMTAEDKERRVEGQGGGSEILHDARIGLCLWFGVSVPLVFLGAYFGFRKANIELPVRTNQIPRQIPVQNWFMRPAITIAVGGVLPFGAVFTELFFIMSSIWQHQFYYLFGFLALVLVILLITCAEIAMALPGAQLVLECLDILVLRVSASSGGYVFLYAIIYFGNRLQIEKAVSTMLYFGYMFIIATLIALMTGATGLLSSFAFVRAIYSSIKID